MEETEEFLANIAGVAMDTDDFDVHEAQRLLLRAITLIRDLRAMLGTGVSPYYDPALDLLKIATSTERQAPSEIAPALLMAADMAQTLQMVVGSAASIAIDGIGCADRISRPTA